MLEPNRGLHGETVLWARIDGSQPPRPVALTRLLLTIPRRRDQQLVRRLTGRNRCRFSGNSPYIQSRIKEVFNIDAGVFLPCVDINIWSPKKEGVERIQDMWLPLAVQVGSKEHGNASIC